MLFFCLLQLLPQSNRRRSADSVEADVLLFPSNHDSTENNTELMIRNEIIILKRICLQRIFHSAKQKPGP